MNEDCRIESILHANNTENYYFSSAYSGATTLDIFNIILNKLIPLQPKKIFIMSGVYDSQILEKGFFSSHETTATIIPTPSLSNLNSDKFLEDRIILLEQIIGLLKHFNIDTIMCTIPHRHNPDDPFFNKYYFETNPLINKICKINNTTRIVANKLGTTFIDFEKSMYDSFDSHYDYCHLTSKGARLVADELIRKNF